MFILWVEWRLDHLLEFVNICIYRKQGKKNRLIRNNSLEDFRRSKAESFSNKQLLS